MTDGDAPSYTVSKRKASIVAAAAGKKSEEVKVSVLATPDIYTLVAGTGEGSVPLVAFDRALLAAGVGNLNLLKVSSILPPSATLLPRIGIAPGSLVPIAYGTICSQVPGESIAAAVGIGIPPSGYGVIMEYSGRVSETEARDTVNRMVVEALTVRRLEAAQIVVKSTEHRVEACGCAFAGVVLWYQNALVK